MHATKSRPTQQYEEAYLQLAGTQRDAGQYTLLYVRAGMI